MPGEAAARVGQIKEPAHKDDFDEWLAGIFGYAFAYCLSGSQEQGWEQREIAQNNFHVKPESDACRPRADVPLPQMIHEEHPMDDMNIFIPITKIDAARRLVYGVVTAETPDISGEVCDYASTKPLYQKWSQKFANATDGKSFGNLRAMHSNIAAGKLVDIAYDDAQSASRSAARWSTMPNGRRSRRAFILAFPRAAAISSAGRIRMSQSSCAIPPSRWKYHWSIIPACRKRRSR